MSCWVHVAAIVRVDSMIELDFTKIFGKELHWDTGSGLYDEYYEHPERFLPCGSEGSLTMSVWENPNPNHFAKYTVSIFGDLRGRFNMEEIINWFIQKVTDEDLCIRDAVIVADNEVEIKHWACGG